jgi:hypothetical protein
MTAPHNTRFTEDRTRTPRGPSTGGAFVGQDVVIPAHLLHAAGTAQSSRDHGEQTNWGPQRQLSVRDNPIWRRLSSRRNRSGPRPALQRSSTAPSQPSTPTPSRPSSPTAVGPGGSTSGNEETSAKSKRLSLPTVNHPRQNWRLSYTPGVPERLTLTPRASTQDLKITVTQHDSNGIATGAPSNPFDDPHSDVSSASSMRSATNPFSTRNNSFSSDRPAKAGQEPFDFALDEPEKVYVPQGGRPRKGTLEKVADAIIPNALQKRASNASYTGLTRTSTMRQTFEKAKTRGQKLQRNKWVQIAFEYGIYLFILLFIYFVLIGIPLWSGAVWWLYWVVANKFVFAGGFSITLGIALL